MSLTKFADDQMVVRFSKGGRFRLFVHWHIATGEIHGSAAAIFVKEPGREAPRELDREHRRRMAHTLFGPFKSKRCYRLDELREAVGPTHWRKSRGWEPECIKFGTMGIVDRVLLARVLSALPKAGTVTVEAMLKEHGDGFLGLRLVGPNFRAMVAARLETHGTPIKLPRAVRPSSEEQPK